MLGDVRQMATDVLSDFSGGMQTTGYLIPDNAFHYGKNIEIRNGIPETRRGIRQVGVSNTEFDVGFYFNEGNARYNDGTHTGFWFPWDFVSKQWGAVQAFSAYRIASDTELTALIVAGGTVYKFRLGFVTEMSLPANTVIASTEEIEFVQAGDSVYMFRGTDIAPLVWSGSGSSWTTVPSAGAGDNMPKGRQGTFVARRLWVVYGDNDLYASDIGDYDDFDSVGQLFSINPGDGDKIVRIVPFKDDKIIVFKQQSAYIVSNINAYVDTDNNETLAQKVLVSMINREDDGGQSDGLIAKNAYVVHGEKVSYLSSNGMTSLNRTAEGTVMGVDVPVSFPIQAWVDRINWTQVSKASAVWHDNYILWSVPINNSTTPNAVFPFDLLGNGGNGAWVGVWESEVLKPYKFLSFRDKCYYIGYDGRVRQMFRDDPWDSEHFFDDVEVYDNSKTYAIGNYVSYEQDGTVTIYKSLTDNNLANYPTGSGGADTTNWSAVSDPISIYYINSQIITRKIHLGDPGVNKIWGRSEVTFGHRNPKVSIDYIAEDFNDETSVYSDQTYSQTQYDVANTADWDDTNVNLDFNNAHRQDYTLFVDDDGFYINDNGAYLNMLEFHSKRFLPIPLNSRMISIKITNTQGYLKLTSILVTGRHLNIAHRER